MFASIAEVKKNENIALQNIKGLDFIHARVKREEGETGDIVIYASL